MKAFLRGVADRSKSAVKWTANLFNIMEPDVPYPVLSISKISMWVTLGMTIWIGVHNPSSSELAASLGAQVAATANYGFRRWVQHKSKTGAYKDVA